MRKRTWDTERAMKKRICERFLCDEWKERVCCADCEAHRFCPNPCLNDPAKCGLLAGRKELDAHLPRHLAERVAGKPRRKMDKAQARELYDQGLTDTEIAETLGFALKTVQGWRLREGLRKNGQ